MKKLFFLLACVFIVLPLCVQNAFSETQKEHDRRMQWWRDARFGMFIHWGLYAVPAGTWDTTTTHGEWIRTTAQIPLKQYDSLVTRFNPVRFNAEQWVKAAKDAGMIYIVITSKHHDGFCMFDSKYTDFDIMSTPFQRDVLSELAKACRKQGMKLCFYHSIMDWHHPDYLPRRDWEKDRPAAGADFERYVRHMKDQLKELLTKYGDIGVLWFDGEWESTWSDERGIDLYKYVRGLNPSIIINNRVSSSRSGLEGFTAEGGFAGDFGTPEQQIPATGMPGTDWESCMTMNDHWGYNKHDKNWKSSKDILRMLADIASKGGNYLLNVGPTAEGVFPPESIERLRDIGAWMNVNGEAIYRTEASPFSHLEWGRCTQKKIAHGTRLYFHVFDWPSDGTLVIPGLYNRPVKAYLLSDGEKTPLKIERKKETLHIAVGRTAADTINTVVVLDVAGRADVNNPPSFLSDGTTFFDTLTVSVQSTREHVEVRFTNDGSDPQVNSPIAAAPLKLKATTTLSAQCFRRGIPVSGIVRMTYTRVVPEPSVSLESVRAGIHYTYFEGAWEKLPAFDSLKAVSTGELPAIALLQSAPSNNFAVEYTGYLRVPANGMYTFYTTSDDGSRVMIGDRVVVDNDGLHGSQEKEGRIALAAGYHPLRIEYFQGTGGKELKFSYRGPGVKKQDVPETMLFIGK
ncbi:MAG TPA: alpha-L-fucosidase [Bacteroidota bacterium]|nr:alpha-L-fucosidase [Bacteroidota bacterium]